MANVIETPQWEPGVYQIETSDPVLGGPAGISNKQGKQLANRTAYLKEQVDSQAAGKLSRSGDTMTGVLLGKPGAATPNNVNNAGFAFSGDPDTGLFSPVDGVLQLATNGEVFFENNAQGVASFKKGVRVPKGVPSALDANTGSGYSFDQDGDTGMFAEGGASNEGSDLVLRVDATEIIRLKTSGAILAGAPSAPTAATGTNSLQLANTAFVQAAIAAWVGSVPATLDTLSELANALNNDPHFAATVINSLALKAPLASPALTGNPTAPTPAQFNNSTQLATTAFVKQSGMQFCSANIFSGSGVLSAAQTIGNLTIFFDLVADIPVLLPPVGDCPQGGTITIRNASATYKVTLSVSDGWIDPDWDGVSSIVIHPGETLALSLYGNVWEAFGGSALLRRLGMFRASLASNGYQKWPSGCIEQWGSVTTNPSGVGTITYPIAFPNAVDSGSLTVAAGGSNYTANFDGNLGALTGVAIRVNMAQSVKVFFRILGR